ncbi:hypothetical protein RUM43_008618, partial [Polyplax serrata]
RPKSLFGHFTIHTSSHGNSLAMHLIRHHQIGGKQKKASGDESINEIGNGTEEINQNEETTEMPASNDLVVRPHEEVTLHCYIESDLQPHMTYAKLKMKLFPNFDDACNSQAF